MAPPASGSARPTSALPRHLPRSGIAANAVANGSIDANASTSTATTSNSFQAGAGAGTPSSSSASRSISRSFVADLDRQHNTSTLSLSPRTAPIRRARRRGASGCERVRDASLGGGGDVSDLSGLPVPVGQPGARHMHAGTGASGRIISTPLSQTHNYTQRRANAGGHNNSTRLGGRGGPRDSLITNSSTSTSGILGADSVLERSSSPDPDYHVEEEEVQEDGEEEDASWTLLDRMRIWRNDALTQHLYSTAVFWGSKVFTKTRDPNDGFWLAQAHFAAGAFSRAERVLTGTWEVPSLSEASAMAGEDKGKGKGRAEAEMAVDEENDGTEGRLSSSTTERGGPAGIGQPNAVHTVRRTGPAAEDDVDTPTLAGATGGVGPAPPQISTVQVTANKRPRALSGGAAVSSEPRQLIRLTDISIACRYLAAQALVRQEKWSAAMDMLGDVNPYRAMRQPGGSRADREAGDGGIKFEASMCHLRGVVQLHLNAIDRAKECFLEALSLDVKCYDSFEALISGNMMDVNEEWHFIQGLAFREHTPEDAEFIRMIYTVRLKKVAHREEMHKCSHALMKEHGLANDPDVLFGLADELYEAMRYSDCYTLTSRILELHDSHSPTLPLHLACMSHLPHLRSSLFLLAHQLVERDPESVLAWYAVGLWYYSTEKWEESRRYFGKGLLLDNRFGPAWIAFAHSFAQEGEHDQAITAYSTAQRHFQGTHLPVMFIGMQYLLLSNVAAASEYLDAAYSMCQVDPLLLNERGVCAYYSGRYTDAINFFTLALQHGSAVQASGTSWASVHLNLGQAYRRLKRYSEAVRSFRACIALEPDNADAHAGMGVSYLYAGQEEEPVLSLHRALALRPGEPSTTALLKIALQGSLDLQEVQNAKGDSMRFPLLSNAVAEELDQRVIEEDEELYGRKMRNSPSEQLDAPAFAGAGGAASSSFASAMDRTSSPPAAAAASRPRQKRKKKKSTAAASEPDAPVERPSALDESLGEEEAIAMRRRHSYANYQQGRDDTAQAAAGAPVPADGNVNEENENDDSTEDMVEASIVSDAFEDR